MDHRIYDIKENLKRKYNMSNELSKTKTSNLPAFMQNEEVVGTEQLAQYVRPPRLKIVQAMSRDPLKKFDPGTIVLVPLVVEFAKVDRESQKGELWQFVPLFFYPEWIQTNPMALASTESFVRQRSLDPRSELAAKAKNRDTWTEPHPERPDLEVSNREVLNFVIVPYSGEYANTLCVMSFSKSNFKDGANLASMIKMRKASICAQVFDCRTGVRRNDKGDWFSYDVSIPSKNPWVTEEEYVQFKAMHLDLAKTHAEGLLQVDYEDENAEQADSSEF